MGKILRFSRGVVVANACGRRHVSTRDTLFSICQHLFVRLGQVTFLWQSVERNRSSPKHTSWLAKAVSIIHLDYIDRQIHTVSTFAEPIDPQNLCVALVSPRQRAHRTFHLLFEHLPKVPDHIIDESVREWDYGKYEGLFKHEILAIDSKWEIWRDG